MKKKRITSVVIATIMMASVVPSVSLTFYKNIELTANASNVSIISTHPEDVSVLSNKLVLFSVEATGDNLSYQWQYSTNNGATWTNVKAAAGKTANLTFTSTASISGRLYRCVVSDGTNTENSKTARLTVLDENALSILCLIIKK